MNGVKFWDLALLWLLNVVCVYPTPLLWFNIASGTGHLLVGGWGLNLFRVILYFSRFRVLAVFGHIFYCSVHLIIEISVLLGWVKPVQSQKKGKTLTLMVIRAESPILPFFYFFKIQNSFLIFLIFLIEKGRNRPFERWAWGCYLYFEIGPVKNIEKLRRCYIFRHHDFEKKWSDVFGDSSKTVNSSNLIFYNSTDI